MFEYTRNLFNNARGQKLFLHYTAGIIFKNCDLKGQKYSIAGCWQATQEAFFSYFRGEIKTSSELANDAEVMVKIHHSK